MIITTEEIKNRTLDVHGAEIERVRGTIKQIQGLHVYREVALSDGNYEVHLVYPRSLQSRVVGYENGLMASRKMEKHINKPKKILEKFKLFVRSRDLNVSDVLTKGRKREHVTLRQMLQYYMRLNTNLTLVKMSEFIGMNQDHTTVIHSILKFETLLEVDKEVQSLYKQFLNFMENEDEN